MPKQDTQKDDIFDTPEHGETSFTSDKQNTSPFRANYSQSEIDSVKRAVQFDDPSQPESEMTSQNNPTTQFKKLSSPKSRLYEGNKTYQNRLEENKKRIEKNQKRAIASPKHFFAGGKSGASPKNSDKLGSPSARWKRVATTNKIKRLNNGKPPQPKPTQANHNSSIKSVTAKNLNKSPNSKTFKVSGASVGAARKNFRSPGDERKGAPLQSKANTDRLKNNVSASRTSRRSRGERKAKVENDQTPTSDQHQPTFDYTNDLNRHTLTNEFQEAE